ncbi:OLC1v1037935C1 [Oldenlandia corymbosa var. corymbosa]|uniref:OLC1v1037935C1 n=1 Tax=Oldenlandia corymbosa var. corymbosa TaxID=529605 RepID=A0AAV1D1R7_OLDCO|nr:OLC1v1037935C1 [Oldenlandia corymbosa var. corymbosa]
MLGKRTTPVIGKLTNSFISGNRAGGLMDVATTSPRSPLEIKMQSPRGLKNYDLGGVGLGIVAALEKSAHHDLNSGRLGSRNLNRSNPIPVNSARTVSTDPKGRRKGGVEEEVEMMMDSLEDYTFVTCHGPGNKSFTRVYYDGGCQEHAGKKMADFERKSSISKRPSMFTVSSPARIGDFPSIPDSDFLKTCHLCHKKLQGKDIYMYRGEKAFCSSECRDSQILMDEHKEKCRSEASRSIEVSHSSYKNGHGRILSPGIFAI